MPDVFVAELARQQADTLTRLHGAEAAGEEPLAEALRCRLDELTDIAARNGVPL